MGITGLDIHLTVGAYSVQSSGRIVLTSQRGAVCDRLEVELPDVGGELAGAVRKDDGVDLFFGYRGGHTQSWQGRVAKAEGRGDAVSITALGPGLEFIKAKVVECFRSEAAPAVVRRLMALAGISAGRLEGPDSVLPHMIFSGVPVFKALRQINETLDKTHQLDMSASPFWVGTDGQGHWGDFDEPGPGFVLASQDNLISHNPEGERGVAVAMLCPGLAHSQAFTVRDLRRNLELSPRAQTVIHQMGEDGNKTTVSYGPERGYS